MSLFIHLASIYTTFDNHCKHTFVESLNQLTLEQAPLKLFCFFQIYLSFKKSCESIIKALFHIQMLEGIVGWWYRVVFQGREKPFCCEVICCKLSVYTSSSLKHCTTY